MPISCFALPKCGPGVPSALTMPLLRRLSIVWPAFGLYVANRLSKVRFSPTMMITCWIGVVGDLANAGATFVSAQSALSQAERFENFFDFINILHGS